MAELDGAVCFSEVSVTLIQANQTERSPWPNVGYSVRRVLFKLGIHLGELWHLADLADWLRAHERSAFLLTAPPLRLAGAVGSPTTPIATV